MAKDTSDEPILPPAEEVAQFKRKLELRTEHIEGVQRAARKLSSRLAEQGEFTLARRLVQRAYRHDNSKFEGVEWNHMDKGFDDPLGKEAILHHQQVNNHHPEYFAEGIKGMSEVQLAEMVCDWHARQSEIGTDLREWVTGKAAEKYEYSLKSVVYKRIKRFVDLLLDPSIA